MNNIITITELLLFAIGLSLVINATHIAFQKEMVLNWLYEWLESKFRFYKIYLKDIHWTEKDRYISGLDNNIIVYENKQIKVEKYKNENTGEIIYYYNTGILIKKDYILSQCYENKYRNNEGLLYIAKPIYACASCMPSIWSIPLYFILVAWKVFIIVIFAIVISTILRDKIFE